MANHHYVDLAPDILRQRLVIEGYPAKVITDVEIKDYLTKLSQLTQMVTLVEPVTHRSEQYGWAGWIHWETSGAHFYAWEKPARFFSADIYTCKAFDPQKVVDFTEAYFNATRITAQDTSPSSGRESTTQSNTATAEFKYTLSDPELRELSTRLLKQQQPRTNDQIVCYCLDGNDELSNLGRHIERVVFEERFGNDDAWMHKFYGTHETVSTFFIAIDQKDAVPIGVLRVCRHSPAGFISLRDTEKQVGVSKEEFMKNYDIKNVDTVWDIITMAVPQRYRSHQGHLLSAMLLRAAHVRARYEGIEHYLAVVDSRVIRTVNSLGLPFKPLAGSGPFEFEGSPESFILYGHPIDFFPAVEQTARDADGNWKRIVDYFSRRFVHGFDIDHRLMYDFVPWPITGKTTAVGDSKL